MAGASSSSRLACLAALLLLGVTAVAAQLDSQGASGVEADAQGKVKRRGGTRFSDWDDLYDYIQRGGTKGKDKNKEDKYGSGGSGGDYKKHKKHDKEYPPGPPPYPPHPPPAHSPSPEPGKSPRPSPSPEPEESPRPSPSPEPGKSPRPSPSPEPEESPRPSPSPEPGKSPRPSPSPEPEESPRPSPSPKPEESPRPSPSPSPGALESPSPEPEESPGPSPSPGALESPSPEPEESPGPSPSPGALASPSPAPVTSPGPSPSPGALESPSPAPVTSPGPSPSPGALESPSPAPPSSPSPSPCPPLPPAPVCTNSEACPAPQPPESVVANVVAGTGSFVWAAIAALPGQDAGAFTGARSRARGSRSDGSAADAAAGTSTGPLNPAAVVDPAFQYPTTVGQGAGFFGAADNRFRPTDEALAVGPGPTAGTNYVLHGVNAAVQIFVASASDGSLLPAQPNATRVLLSTLMQTTNAPGPVLPEGGQPSAWFDKVEQRFVLVWTTAVGDVNAITDELLLFVAVSETADPLGVWSVRALYPRPPWPYGCASGFVPSYPQATYTSVGLFVTLGAFCTSKLPGQDFSSILWAYPKAALYAPVVAGQASVVPGAVWLLQKAWLRSIPAGQSDNRPWQLNNFAQPARPQDAADEARLPLFVQKVDDAFMSVATVTGDEHLATMTTPSDAPQLLANLFAKGFNFSNDGFYEGDAAMPQPDTPVRLSSGDTGLAQRGYAVRSYGAVQSGGTLYLTTSEFFGFSIGDGTGARVPSVYWATLAVADADLCTPNISRTAFGLIASADGLSFGFPVIAARPGGGGAVVAFAYSGAGNFTGAAAATPQFAGVATSTITAGVPGGVQVVQLGQGSITSLPDAALVQRYGDYSALQVADGRLWYAVPTTRLPAGGDPALDGQYASWVGSQVL